MYAGFHVPCPLFLWDFNGTWILSADFRKVPKYEISWPSVQWGAELFHSDGRRRGQTDKKELIIAFAILRTHLKFQIVPYREHASLLHNKYLMLFKDIIIQEGLASSYPPIFWLVGSFPSGFAASWRRMLKIKWTDRITNGEVFQRAKEERLLSKI